MNERLSVLIELTAAHLRISLLALSVAVAVSVPLGIAVVRHPKFQRWVIGTASVIQTVPGLAMLAFMVPALAALSVLTSSWFGFGLPSIGLLPAGAGLTLYAMLPIIRNTVVGIEGVNDAVKEASRGVGMTLNQQLRMVELPLAFPTIVAGVRTASAWTVGMATLSTPVGAASLGNLIFAGLQTRRYDTVMWGCLGSAGLALVLDGLIWAFEQGARQRRRAMWMSAAGALALLAMLAIGSLVAGATTAQTPAVRVGAKTFTEQYVLAEVVAQQLRSADPNVRVDKATSLGSTVAYDALRAGDLDLYVDYSGTIWATIMHRRGSGSRAEVLSAVKEYLEARAEVVPLAVLGFENTYALAVRQDDGPAAKTITQLSAFAPSLAFAADYEFLERPEWRALRNRYGLHFREHRAMDASLMYPAIAGKQVDVIAAYTTEGRLDAYNLRLLEDDKNVIPPYDAILLASQSFVDRHPTLTAELRKLSHTIDEENNACHEP